VVCSTRASWFLWQHIKSAQSDVIEERASEKLTSLFVEGVAAPLIALLGHSSRKVMRVALQVTAQLTSSEDAYHTDCLIEQGLLSLLYAELLRSNATVQRQALFACSNILAGTHEQISAVIDADLVSIIIPMLDAQSFAVQKEAVSGAHTVVLNELASHAYIDHSLTAFNRVRPTCCLLSCQLRCP
jgi:hypothetical protein